MPACGLQVNSRVHADSRRMTSDLDIYRSAAVLIRQHGEDAALEAASRAGAMLERGDVEGQAVWKRILAAVKELQRRERPEGATRH